MYQKQQRREILYSNLRKKVIVNLSKRRAFTFRIFLFLYIKKKKRLLSLSSLALDTKRNNTDKWNWFNNNNNTSLLELTCFVFIVMQRFHHSNKNIFYSSPSDWLTSFTSSNVIGQLFIIVIAVVQTFCYGSKQKLFSSNTRRNYQKKQTSFLWPADNKHSERNIIIQIYIVISFTLSK